MQLTIKCHFGIPILTVAKIYFKKTLGRNGINNWDNVQRQRG